MCNFHSLDRDEWQTTLTKVWNYAEFYAQNSFVFGTIPCMVERCYAINILSSMIPCMVCCRKVHTIFVRRCSNVPYNGYGYTRLCRVNESITKSFVALQHAWWRWTSADFNVLCFPSGHRYSLSTMHPLLLNVLQKLYLRCRHAVPLKFELVSCRIMYRV